MSEVKSRTIKIKNALVTIHGYSNGTAILNITGRASEATHSSIWMSPAELRELGSLCHQYAADMLTGESE